MSKFTMMVKDHPAQLPAKGDHSGCYFIIKNAIVRRFEFTDWQQEKAYNEMCEFYNSRKDKDLLYCQYMAR